MAKNTDVIVENKNLDEQIAEEEQVKALNPEQIRADEELASFLGEKVKDGKVLEEPKVEDKKVETAPLVEETPKKEEVITPPIDPVKLKEEISQATAEKIVNALAGDNKTKEEKKDILAEAPWTKEKRDPTWQEALEFMAERNKKQVKEEIMQELSKEVEQEELSAKQAEEQQIEKQKQVDEAYNNQWNSEFADLEATGKIPKANPANKDTVTIHRVIDGKDTEIKVPADPGQRARYEIFAAMQRVAYENIKQGKPPLMSAKVAFYEHYKPAGTQPAGADAPIYGVKRSVSQDNPNSFTAAEVHNSGFEDILRGN